MTTPEKLKPEDVFDFTNLAAMPEEQREHFIKALHVLIQLAADHLKYDLFRYGNRITPAHGDALAAILRKFTMLAARISTGRWVYDLDTGMGKTTSVIAWITSVLQLEFPFSIAVAASQVESLCDIKRALLAKGINEERIGLEHSKQFKADKAKAAQRGDPAVSKDYASMPSTDDNHLRQVVLATHENLRSGPLTSYRGRDRDLVIWDESLLVSDVRSIPLLRAQQALGWLQPRIFNASNRDPQRALQEQAFEYVENCVLALQTELEEQLEEKRPPRPVEFPHALPQQLGEYQRILKRAFAGDAPHGDGKALRDLLAMSGNSVRVLQAGNQAAVIQFDVAVPDSLERVVILDASYPVRLLEQLDDGLQHDPEFNGRVKQYSRVTIHFWQRAAGRGSIEGEFAQKNPDDRVMSREILEVVKAIPDDEAVLIFTFKPRGHLDVMDVLRRDLQRGGVDPDGRLPGGRPRIAFLTWGRETSLNEFSYVQHVIFAGTFHRAHHDLAGAILGQRRDLLAEVTGADVNNVRLSEVAHSVYQALSRGCCRVVEDGEAKRMDVWLANGDPGLVEHLEALMPGVNVETWATVHAPQGGRAALVATIVDYLANQPAEITRVSMKAAKKACCPGGCAARTWQRARVEALEELRRRNRLLYWEVQGGYLVRARPDF